MNVYCKIETQEDYAYFLQYDPSEYIQYPCLFNIDTRYLSESEYEIAGILIDIRHTPERNAEWITVEEMKQLTFMRSLEL